MRAATRCTACCSRVHAVAVWAGGRTVSGKRQQSPKAADVGSHLQQPASGKKKTVRGRTPTPPPRPAPTARAVGSRRGSTPPRTPSPFTQFFGRFTAGELLLGDIVMVAATEVSSERIPYEQMPLLAGVSIACWVLAATLLGDYKEFPPTTDNWYLNLLGPVFLAVVDSTLTWGIAVVISLAVFSALVSGNHLDPYPLLNDLTSENLSPQLEVAVATLITMACWRGIAARLRSY